MPPLRRSEHSNTIDSVRGHIHALLDGQLTPQQTAEAICEEALGRDDGQWPWLWLLWAALGAPRESGQDAAERAECDIMRAAQEWLDLSDEEAEWRAYFDRWLGEILRWQPAAARLLQNAQVVGATYVRARPESSPGSTTRDRRLGRYTDPVTETRRSRRRRHCA